MEKDVQISKYTFYHFRIFQKNCSFSGIHLWTLGQRIHLGGLKQAYFVAEINSETQDIIVVSKKQVNSIKTNKKYKLLNNI